MTRILLDARQTRQMSVGMKRYVTELVARLPQVASDFDFAVFEGGENFGWREQVVLPAIVGRSGCALVHYMSIYTPLVSVRASVVTVHDLLHMLFPGQFKTKVRLYYRTAVRRACSRALRVITDDERTVTDLERFLDVDPNKVRVIPLGAAGAPYDSPCKDADAPQQRPYFLYVGNHRVHKNISTLLDAWYALPEECCLDLHLTGPDDFEGALARASRYGRRATAIGDVADGELTRCYRDAVALVHPALREGFGLPMLEAMACGVPVVASETAVPRPLDGAVLTFPPRDVGTLTQMLVRVATDEPLRRRLIDAGHERARSLTWDRCAKATAAVYREVVG